LTDGAGLGGAGVEQWSAIFRKRDVVRVVPALEVPFNLSAGVHNRDVAFAYTSAFLVHVESNAA